jgi:hypothetical protein
MPASRFPMTTEDLNGFLRLAKEAKSEFIAVGYPPDICAGDHGHGRQVPEGEQVPHYVNVDAKTFDNTEIDKYYQPI